MSLSWTASPYPFIQMNPKDMEDLKLKQGDLVEVYNDNGSTQAMAYPTPTARPKQTFMLFALPDRRAGQRGVGRRQRVHHPQLQANVGRVSGRSRIAPEGVKHLSFKSIEYTA